MNDIAKQWPKELLARQPEMNTHLEEIKRLKAHNQRLAKQSNVQVVWVGAICFTLIGLASLAAWLRITGAIK